MNKLGLRCAKLRPAWASYQLAFLWLAFTVVGLAENKANSAPIELELELELSLAKKRISLDFLPT